MKTSWVLLISCALAGRAAAQPAAAPSYTPPAAVVDISTYLINAIVERPVNRIEPVRELVLDTEVWGVSQTRALVQARTTCEFTRARLDIVLTGSTFARTVGIQDIAKAHTQGTTVFEAVQPITIDGKCVRAWPVKASARMRAKLICATDLQDNPDSPETGGARYQFYDTKAEIETVVARRTEFKLKTQFAAELRPEVEKLSQSMAEAYKTVAALGIPLQPLRWSSSEIALRLEVGQAPGAAPPEAVTRGDVIVRIHQSTLDKIAQQLAAGKTFSPFDLARLQASILSALGDPASSAGGLKSLEGLLKGLGVASFATTLADQDPITFQAADGTLTITLHGKSFKTANRSLPARDVQVRYRLESAGKQVALVRDGAVKVLAAGAEADDDQDIAKVLQDNFNLFLPNRLLVPGIQVPRTTIHLTANQAQARGGWLLVSWAK